MSAYKVSTVRDSKVQLWRTGSRPRAFQRAIDRVCMLPVISPKGGSKFSDATAPYLLADDEYTQATAQTL